MKNIRISDYSYPLPPERIATHPLASRDQSRLLVYQNGVIRHQHFHQLPELLPPKSQLYFNDTKVIPARLHFQKSTGAHIEIFLLRPADDSLLHHHAMDARRSSKWICTIGNLKKWSGGLVLTQTKNRVSLQATLINSDRGEVELSWDPSEKTFAEIVSLFGAVPLPPYIKRKAEPEDKDRYQTVYSRLEGAVAAPTAGLHFTKATFDELRKKEIPTHFLTLHVSAGTFRPVKTENAFDHPMHAEQLLITRENVLTLLNPEQRVIAVGTTSMRILESAYWLGVRILEGNDKDFRISQDDPYKDRTHFPSKSEALQAILKLMEQNHFDAIAGDTSIYILPGYEFKIVEGLITNFHQPSSTLMLLVGAFVGNDWRRIYQAALDNTYRFLSYGDSSLLLP